MNRNRKLLIAKFVTIASVVPILIYAHSFGPPPGAAGPPSDRTCSSPGCHSPALPGKGSVSVNFPNGLFYTPGVKQHLVLTIEDPDQHRWGFQSTVRPSSNPRSTEAGDFESTDSFTQVVCQDGSTKPAGQPCPPPGFQYVEHTLEGTRLGTPSPVSFAFDWTPPAAGMGDLLFYIAANAANGDGTPQGDHIYFKNYTLKQASGEKPAISQNGVVSAASGAPGITAGSWCAIYGTNLSMTTRGWRPDEIVNGKLPTQLDGVSVTVDNRPAFVSYISPTQINVQAPSDSSEGPVPVQVTTPAGISDPLSATMQKTIPAFFLWQGRYVAAQHADYSPVGPPGLFPDVTTMPAHPGEVVVLYGTGFGDTTPQIPAGQLVDQPATLTSGITIRIGGTAAEVSYDGLTPQAAGLYQFNVKVPDTAPDGDLAVVAEYGGMQSQGGAFLTVKR